LKILYLSDVYFPRINGVSTSIQTFTLELEKLGHEVRLIAPAYPQAGPSPPWIKRVRSRRVPFDPEDRLMSRRELRALMPDLQKEFFDLIHVQTPFLAHSFGVELAKFLDLPLVETYHTFFEEYLYHYVPLAPRSWMQRLARNFSRRQGNEVDSLIVPSRAMEAALRGYGVTRPIVRLPTGLRIEEFRGGNGQAFRERYRIRDGRPTLVHIGRLAHEKNIDFLLRMLVEVVKAEPEVLLIVAGEGPALPSLQRLGRDLGLSDNLLFVGYLDRQNTLLDCYRAADAFVFASRTETQGLVLLEAMALAVPVVSTAVMGTRDILEPGLGSLIAPENEQAFAAQVLRVLREPTLRLRLRREASEFALKQWDATTMARRLVEVYESLVGRNELAAIA
jgi:1,2-diacylglycerol 3-alpha-glucosyltransferase